LGTSSMAKIAGYPDQKVRRRQSFSRIVKQACWKLRRWPGRYGWSSTVPFYRRKIPRSLLGLDGNDASGQGSKSRSRGNRCGLQRATGGENNQRKWASCPGSLTRMFCQLQKATGENALSRGACEEKQVIVLAGWRDASVWKAKGI